MDPSSLFKWTELSLVIVRVLSIMYSFFWRLLHVYKFLFKFWYLLKYVKTFIAPCLCKQKTTAIGCHMYRFQCALFIIVVVNHISSISNSKNKKDRKTVSWTDNCKDTINTYLTCIGGFYLKWLPTSAKKCIFLVLPSFECLRIWCMQLPHLQPPIICHIIINVFDFLFKWKYFLFIF